MAEITLILGGAGGIGGRAARALVEGTSNPVWITYRADSAAAEALADELPAGYAIRYDAADPSSIGELAATVEAKGHRVRNLIHAIVDTVPGRLLDLDPDRVLASLDVSALSLLRACHALEPQFADGGSVVFVTSIGSTRVVPDYGAVGIAKAMAEALVRYLAAELGSRGIRVNALSAGPVHTKALEAMFDPEIAEKMVRHIGRRSPLQPPAELTDIGAGIVALCSPALRGMTGQVLAVDGGGFLSA